VVVRPQTTIDICGTFIGGARKLTRDNLEVVWARFSTLSSAVFVMSVIRLHAQAQPHLELKTRARICPANLNSLSLSMVFAIPPL